MNQKKINSNKEILSLISTFLLSILLLVLINDEKKYVVFIHSIYATFLIAMGIIVLNTIKFNVNKFSIFFGSVFATTGILEIIFAFMCLNHLKSAHYDYDLLIFTSIIMDLLPVLGIYMSLNYLYKNKLKYEIIILNTISFLLIFLFIIITLNWNVKQNKIFNYEEFIMITENIVNIVTIIIAIFIINKLKITDDKLDEIEKGFFKKITIIIILARIPSILHLFLNDLYFKDILKQIITNFEIYYLYQYIVHTNVKKPYKKLNSINNELIQKSESLNTKNKKLIEETKKIQDLKNMLSSKEAKLKSTLDTSVNCIIVFNDKKEITYANKMFLNTFKTSNKTEDYNIDKNIKPLIKDYNKFINNIDYAFDKNKSIEEITYTTTNKIYQTIFAPLNINGTIQGTLCIMIDKTKKKEFEEKIIDINTRYERFLESIGDGIVVIQNGQKIYANKACKDIFKDRLDTIDFKGDYEKENLEQCHEIDGKKVYVEMSYSQYTKNNENKTIIVIRDITKRKKAQLKLKESQKSYARLIDILPDGICLLDNNLKIDYANQSLLNMVKVSSMSELKNLNIKKLINLTLDEESKFERKMKKVINENKYMLLLEHEIKSYSGENIQVEVNALPFSIDEHKNIMLIIKDLTHKKTSEMAEKELLDRLKTDKIKTEFFANMSHELKTPLNVISSSNQLVDSLYKNGKIEDYNDNMKSHIELVRQSAYRLQRLISNIIDLTKMESGFYNLKLANHNIVNVIEDLFAIVEQYASKKDISLVFDTDNEEININIDKVEIERIILNLLSNCIKFTNNGGSIFVNIYDGIDIVTISVKDNGVGIPKNKIDIIFEEFAQVDKTLSRNTEGSGIGLTIVKNLVELHQGDIKVNSKENIGTEFIITIPKTSLTKEDYKEDKRIYNIDEKVKIEFSDIYY